jgi:hypothetical protein
MIFLEKHYCATPDDLGRNTEYFNGSKQGRMAWHELLHTCVITIHVPLHTFPLCLCYTSTNDSLSWKSCKLDVLSTPILARNSLTPSSLIPAKPPTSILIVTLAVTISELFCITLLLLLILSTSLLCMKIQYNNIGSSLVHMTSTYVYIPQ